MRYFRLLLLYLLPAFLASNVFASGFDVYVRDMSGTADIFSSLRYNSFALFERDSVLYYPELKVYSAGIEIDSAFQYAVMYERIYDRDIKMPRVLKMSDFIDMKAAYEDSRLWLSSVTKNLGIETASVFSGDEIALDIPFKIKSKTFHRVFGGSNIGLRVKGSLSISLTGQKSYTDLPNAVNESFDFTLDQTQNISIRGKVGTKVDVDIAQNTESLDFENTLKITYTGESDEIIQKLEAGNIGLSLPGTRYVSFSGVNKGLFGLKAETKVGKLRSTSILSFEKGKKNQIEIKGGVRKQERVKNAKDYLRYKYFYIDESFKQNMATPENYERIKEHLPLLTSGYKIKNYSLQLFVARTETGTQPDAEIYIDYLDPADTITTADGLKYPNLYQKRKVKIIEEDQYEINYELGYIRLKSLYLSGSDILGVKYIKQSISNPSDIIEVGSADSTGTKLKLQILAEYNQKPSDPWDILEWKNVYSLDGVDISRDEFKLTIQKNTPGGLRTEEYDISNSPKPYLYWYEVSKKDVSDEVDLGFLMSSYGEFHFPNQRPFMPDANSIIRDPLQTTADSLFTDGEIYTNSFYTSSQFALKFEYSSKSSTYSLGFNVIEGSEVVRSGATTLRKDVDYIINYNSGQLSIINERYLTADIEILYESASIFQMDQKLLVGNRIEYSFARDSYLGATVLYLSEESSQERVHVGFEPKRNLVLDVNGQTVVGMPFLTKAIDWLPLIETDKESKLSLEGEVAMIIPDPNPLGVAYIDDFESSRIKKSLGISYMSWSEASYPDNYITNGIYELIDEVKAMAGNLGIAYQEYLKYFLKAYSGKDELSFYWYNPKDEDKYSKEQIYKDVPADQRKDKVNTMNVVFKPSARNSAISGREFSPADSWGGIMRYLHSAYQDMREVKYIEFLVSTNRNVTLNIDIGELSEDVIPDRKLNTEDVNRNSVLDVGDNSEDTGIDGMRGTGDFIPLYEYDPNAPREREPYEFLSFDNHPVESDGKPTPDSQMNNYWDFVKTENNGRLDSEDLDGGGNLDTSVRAYRYVINLKSSPVFGEQYVVSTDFSSGSNFALYRIPIEEFASILNREPDLSKMKYIKLWFNNSPDTTFSTRVNFVSLDLVGNEWAAKGSNRGKIEAKTINNQDDKGRYYSPPGVKRFDDNGFEEPEQSLSLNISLSPYMSQDEYENGRSAFLTKELISAENYLQYKEIKMFIHGGMSANDPSWDEERPLYFIYRFGTDSVNYYEYRSKLVNGWKNSEVNNQMIIQFDDLTDLKTQRSDLDLPAGSVFFKGYNDGDIKRYIGIRGNPTLQAVKFFNAGVLDSAGTGLNTEIWINEFRLTKVMRDPGTAMRIKTRIEAADIATFDAEMTRQDEEFHRIEESRGTGVNQLNTNLNATINLDRITPKKIGLSLPVRYSYFNTSSYTKYQGSTDILVDKNNIPDSVRTENTRHQYDFSVRKTAKSNNPYIKYTLDNINLSGNASFSESSNPSYAYQKTKNYNYNLSYSLGLPETWFSFSPFFWGKDISFFKSLSGVKFAFFPNTYNFSINTGQSETQSLSRRNNFTESRSFLVTRNFSTSLSPLPFIKSDYSLSMRSDMYKDAIKRDSTGQDTVISVFNKDLTDVMKLDFGELSGLESSLNNNVKISVSKYMQNDLNLKASYSWAGNLASRIPSSNMKNNYTSKLNSRLKTKEIISEIQTGVNYIFPEKKETEKKDSVKIQQQEERKPDGASRLSRTSTSTGKKKSILDFLKENLSDFTMSYSQGRENTYSDIKSLEQADPFFMFALSDKPEGIEYTSSSWSGNWGMSGSTSLSITKNLRFDGISYNFARTYRQNNNEGFTGNDTETRFVWPWVTDAEHRKTGADPYYIPNYSINISGLQELLLAKESISNLTISHSKSGSENIQWYVDGNAPGLYLTGIPDLGSANVIDRSASYSTGFSPLAGLRLSLKNGFSFSANYDYSFDMRETYSNNNDIRSIQSGEKKYTRGLRISAGYNQKGGFKIPFNFWPFSGKKLDNDISYNLSVSYNSNSTHKYNIEKKEYDGLENGIISDNFTISPDINYKISRKLNGTVSYSYNYNETKSYEARSIVNTNHKFELRAVLSITGN